MLLELLGQDISFSTLTPSLDLVAGGSSVTIAGTRLGAINSVYFGTNPATILSKNYSEIIVQVPSGSLGVCPVTLDTITQSNAFRYVSSRVSTVTSVVPAGSPIGGGVNVTLTGTDLDSVVSVVFGGSAGT